MFWTAVAMLTWLLLFTDPALGVTLLLGVCVALLSARPIRGDGFFKDDCYATGIVYALLLPVSLALLLPWSTSSTWFMVTVLGAVLIVSFCMGFFLAEGDTWSAGLREDYLDVVSFLI